MAERRFPRPDAQFDAYMNHYYAQVALWWEAQGLDPDLLAALKTGLVNWDDAYPAHVAAQAAAESARQAKDAARTALEAAARPVTSFIQSYPATTDPQRAAIGITVRDAAGAPVAPPTTRPRAFITAGQRLMHTLRLADESTPTRRARPRGILGAEVWVKLVAPPGTAATIPPAADVAPGTTAAIPPAAAAKPAVAAAKPGRAAAIPVTAAAASGSAVATPGTAAVTPGTGDSTRSATDATLGASGSTPGAVDSTLGAAVSSYAASLGDPATFTFLAMAIRPSLTAEFPAADGGRTAIYMLRWVNTRGEKGPWSALAAATVAA